LHEIFFFVIINFVCLQEEYGTEFPVKSCRMLMQFLEEPGRPLSLVPRVRMQSLMGHLAVAPEVDWYKFQDGKVFGFSWTMFWYLRTLPSTPFDPQLNTDDVDAEVAQQVYEQVGLITAAPAGDRPLQIAWIPECLDYDSWRGDRSPEKIDFDKLWN
jgi:hypothetical protein